VLLLFVGRIKKEAMAQTMMVLLFRDWSIHTTYCFSLSLAEGEIDGIKPTARAATKTEKSSKKLFLVFGRLF